MKHIAMKLDFLQQFLKQNFKQKFLWKYLSSSLQVKILESFSHNNQKVSCKRENNFWCENFYWATAAAAFSFLVL